MKKAISILLTVIFSTVSHAVIWTDTKSWTINDEINFSQWMKTNAVNENMFVDPKSKYYGINSDCADTSYAFRAIFAFENGLPFAITNPSGSRSGKTINNRQTNYDQIENQTARFIAFINDIGESVGTENLSLFDTYPVSIKSIQSGSLFTYKIKARFGNFIRHSYNIKAINPTGTFDVIYSTQAVKEKKLPLIRRKEKEFENLPHQPWGFRKFRWPEHLGKELSVIPQELGASLEQYELASKMNDADFFKYVRKQLADKPETLAERLTRTLKTTCLESNARIEYVNQAIEHLNKTQNSCMNYEDFDAYSTPARDKALSDTFLKLEDSYKELKKANQLNTIDPILLGFAEEILDQGLFASKSESLALLEYCPIEYRAGVKISLKTLYKRIRNNSLSSHPNDSLEIRWGEDGKKTNCKRWY